MFQEILKNYIDAFFKVYEEDLKSLPKLPYDEDEPSSLYVGEIDEEGWIEWQYVPVDMILDFSELEEEYAIHLSEELKEYYNSFYFLELCGFWNNKCIMLDKIDAATDVLDDFRSVLNEQEDMIEIGSMDSYASVFVKFVSGRVVLYDWEFEEEAVLADSLSEFFTKLKVRMDQVE